MAHNWLTGADIQSKIIRDLLLRAMTASWLFNLRLRIFYYHVGCASWQPGWWLVGRRSRRVKRPIILTEWILSGNLQGCWLHTMPDVPLTQPPSDERVSQMVTRLVARIVIFGLKQLLDSLAALAGRHAPPTADFERCGS